MLMNLNLWSGNSLMTFLRYGLMVSTVSRIIVSDNSVFLRRCGVLEDWLVKRGHETFSQDWLKMR